MKKGTRKSIHSTAKLNVTLNPLLPRSRSNINLHRKTPPPIRPIGDTSIKKHLLNRQQVAEKPKFLSRVQSLPGLQKPGIAINHQSSALPKNHKHRLSIDGSGDLNQSHPREQTPLKDQTDIQEKKSRGTVTGSTKDILRFIKVQADQTDLSLSHISMKNAPDTSDSGLPRPHASRGASRARLIRVSNSQSFGLVNQKETNVVQRFAFRSQTGSIGGMEKKHNQDNFLICQDFGGAKNQWFFGVFDGHGQNGHDVSGHIKRSLPQHLQQFLNKSSKSLSEEEIRALSMGLVSSFMYVNHELMRSTQIDATFSGSTAVTVLVKGDLVLCANTGDSRAIIGRLRNNETWVSIPLSKDHKPDNPVERERIEKAGGRVEPFQGNNYLDPNGVFIGPARVWTLRDPVPGLAMSRSLGDFVAGEIGVTAEPEIIRVSLGREDKFLVLASDGIWEFISSQAVRPIQCVELIAPYWHAGNIEGACDKLLREALTCWRRVRLI